VIIMQKVDGFVVHAQHRAAKDLFRQWKEDLARWREEQERAMSMLKAIRAAWEESAAALEVHARQIQVLEEHLLRHEQELRDANWPVEASEDESMVSEHQKFQSALARAGTGHKQMQELYCGVMSEVFELLKLTHPDAVVLETN
jgi:hypothetical protein